MAANNNNEDMRSNMSLATSTNKGLGIFRSSGDEAALHEMGIIYIIWMTCYHSRGRVRMLQHNIGLRGDQYIQRILNGHSQNYIKLFQMEVKAFRAICNPLRQSHNMESTKWVSVEELAGMYYLLVDHSQCQCAVGDYFQHLSETINRHVKTLMQALHELQRTMIVPIHIIGVHAYIAGHPQNYPLLEVMTSQLSNIY